MGQMWYFLDNSDPHVTEAVKEIAVSPFTGDTFPLGMGLIQSAYCEGFAYVPANYQDYVVTGSLTPQDWAVEWGQYDTLDKLKKRLEDDNKEFYEFPSRATEDFLNVLSRAAPTCPWDDLAEDIWNALWKGLLDGYRETMKRAKEAAGNPRAASQTPRDRAISFCVNGKQYSAEEVAAIYRFYQDCIDRGDVDHALGKALSDLFMEDPAIAEFGRENFKKVHKECMKRLPLWKHEREDFLSEAEWAYKDLAAVAIRDMYAQRGEAGK